MTHSGLGRIIIPIEAGDEMMLALLTYHSGQQTTTLYERELEENPYEQ